MKTEQNIATMKRMQENMQWPYIGGMFWPYLCAFGMYYPITVRRGIAE